MNAWDRGFAGTKTLVEESTAVVLSNSDEDNTSSEDNDEPANYETPPRFTIDEHILVPANIQLAEWVVKHGIPNTATANL